MWDFMGSLPADLPKIIVVEDLTKPVIYGSMWGEVTIKISNLKPVREGVFLLVTPISIHSFLADTYCEDDLIQAKRALGIS